MNLRDPHAILQGPAAPDTAGQVVSRLHERSGPLMTMSSYHLADSFHPTIGTARSALAMLDEEFLAFRDGKLVPLPTDGGAREVRFPGEKESWYAVAIPGGDLLSNEVAGLALERGGHLRVGLEDHAGPGQPTNVEILERAAKLCSDVGRPLARPEEAARLMKVKR